MNNCKEILDNFITQSHEGDLKYSHYPNHYSDLKMKVSFGMGAPAKIPWIAFIGSEMLVSNGFYPVYLYYKDLNMLILAYGISETSEYKQSWPDHIISSCSEIKNYVEEEDLDKIYRYGDSFVYKAYHIDISDDLIQYRSHEDNKYLSSSDLSSDLDTIIDQYAKSINIEIRKENSLISQGRFYMEKHLEEFIISNWDETELGAKYELIYEDGDLKSQQYKTGIGPIDILAKDKETGSYVVIELKKNQTSDDTVGQITRYMGWIKENKNDDNVKGIIIAAGYTQKLKYALNYVKSIEVFLYEVDFKLKEFER